MTRIAICDNKHFEVTYTVIKLLDAPGTELTIFIHAEGYQQLTYLLGERINDYQWIIQEQHETNRHFINRMFAEIKNRSVDILYLTTVSDNFILYAYHLRKSAVRRTIMTLHDLNGWFTYRAAISLRRLVRYVGKRSLLGFVHELNVLSDGLEVYLQSLTKRSKRVFVIPGSCYEPGLFPPAGFVQGNIIRIVVPGTIDIRRRNYEDVITLLTAAEEAGLPIHITLLGGFSEEHSGHFKKLFLDYCVQHRDLQVYEQETVAQSLFDKTIQECHFIWMPLQTSVMINDGVTETYGQSICSGNVGDVIRFAKPFFAPSWLLVDEALSAARLRYEQVSEIIITLQKCMQDYEQLTAKAMQASLHYTKEAIMTRNRDLFSGIGYPISARLP